MTNKQLAERLYVEVFGRGNLAAADEIMAAEVVNHGPGSPPIVGRDQIKQQALRLREAIPDLQSVLNDQVAEGDRVASRWTGRGTFTGPLLMPAGRVEPNGKTVSFDEIRIDRFADGLIVESWFIPDRFALWQQMGVLG